MKRHLDLAVNYLVLAAMASTLVLFFPLPWAIAGRPITPELIAISMSGMLAMVVYGALAYVIDTAVNS